MNDKRKAYQQQYREQYKTQVKRVNLTFTHKEYRAFLRAAEGENRTVTGHVKQLALAGLEQQTPIPSDIKETLQTLSFAVRNIANNVNQIARHSNTVNMLASAEENNLLLHLKQLDDAVQHYTEGRINNDDH